MLQLAHSSRAHVVKYRIARIVLSALFVCMSRGHWGSEATPHWPGTVSYTLVKAMSMLFTVRHVWCAVRLLFCLNSLKRMYKDHAWLTERLIYETLLNVSLCVVTSDRCSLNMFENTRILWWNKICKFYDIYRDRFTAYQWQINIYFPFKIKYNVFS